MKYIKKRQQIKTMPKIMTKIAFMLFLNCLNLHATTYEESKFIQFLKDSGERRLLKIFKSNADTCFKEDIKKFYGALDELIEDKTQTEKNTICDEVVSILKPQSSGKEILKSLREIEKNSVKRTIEALGRDFLKKVDEQYLERSLSAYFEILEDKSKRMMKYETASINKIKEALDKGFSVLEDQKKLFQSSIKSEESELLANVKKFMRNPELSEQEFDAGIGNIYFEHANKFRPPLLSVANFGGIFDMVEGDLEDEKREKEQNLSISDKNVDTELDLVLKGVNADLRTWILDRINDASEDEALPISDVIRFLKNKISGKMVKENPDKGDEIQLKKELECFLNSPVLKSAVERSRILKNSVLESTVKQPQLTFNKFSDKYSEILLSIDFGFSQQILKKFFELDGKIDMEQTLQGVVQNLWNTTRDLTDPIDRQIAEAIVESKFNESSLERNRSPFYEEEHVGIKPSKRVKPDA